MNTILKVLNIVLIIIAIWLLGSYIEVVVRNLIDGQISAINAFNIFLLLR